MSIKYFPDYTQFMSHRGKGYIRADTPPIGGVSPRESPIGKGTEQRCRVKGGERRSSGVKEPMI